MSPQINKKLDEALDAVDEIWVNPRLTEGWFDSFEYILADFFDKKIKENKKPVDSKVMACKGTQAEKQAEATSATADGERMRVPTTSPQEPAAPSHR